MKKLRNSSGFTLIEMLAALLVLVMLVMGMEAGMSAATRAYRESVFESNSGSLAGILNTALGDILRYSEDIRTNEHGNFETPEGIPLPEVGFVFTNLEYGVQNGYFYTEILADGSSRGTLQIKNLQDSSVTELVNTGAYPNLEVTNFHITYHAPAAGGGSAEGGYFEITYDILDSRREGRSRSVESIVRLMNPER